MFHLVCDMWSSSEREKLLIVVLTFLMTAILAFWFSWIVKKSKGIPSLPPGPRGFPLIGYLPFLGSDLQKKFTELAQVYGPIYKLSLGNKLWIVISSESIAKQVVRDQDTILANRDSPIAARIVTYGGTDIAFSSLGPAWKNMRKVFVHEMLGNASLEALYAVRKQEIKKTIRYVYSNIGKPLNVGQLSFETTINTSMNMMWGGILEEEAGNDAGTKFQNLTVELMMLLGTPNISDFFPMLAMLDLQGLQNQAEKLLLSFDEFFNPIIERAQKMVEANKPSVEENRRRDFLQLLLELKEHGHPETSISTNKLKAILVDIVFGGTDTTSTMVEWVIAELMQHQEIMRKVYIELDEVVGLNSFVEEFHLPKLSYLDAVVKETFRLHPPVPLLVPRRASQSCTLGEYTIPKGSTVFVNVYAIHRDTNLWDNPLEFRPERFLNTNSTSKFDYSGNNFKFLPFGSGRRICAGLPLAEKMLMHQLASFLHSFEWKLPKNTNLELSYKHGLVLRKLKPLVAIPTPRLSAI